MNGDIRPPAAGNTNDAGVNNVPPERTVPAQQPQQVPKNDSREQHLSDIQVEGPSGKKKPRMSRLKCAFIVVLSIVLIILAGAIVMGIWYTSGLAAVDTNKTDKEKFVVESGAAPSDVADKLETNGLIRNATVFSLYARLSGQADGIKAGTYRLSPSMSVANIVKHLGEGTADTFTLTFYPGATLRDTTDKPSAQKTDVTSQLLKAGYTQEAIDAAFSKEYDHPVLATKPSSADLEGYLAMLLLKA